MIRSEYHCMWALPPVYLLNHQHHTAVDMSCISQNFRLFLISNLSVRTFEFFCPCVRGQSGLLPTCTQRRRGGDGTMRFAAARAELSGDPRSGRSGTSGTNLENQHHQTGDSRSKTCYRPVEVMFWDKLQTKQCYHRNSKPYVRLTCP